MALLGNFNNPPEVRLLLKARAEMETKDSRGLTALKVAEASESWTAFGVIIDSSKSAGVWRGYGNPAIARVYRLIAYHEQNILNSFFVDDIFVVFCCGPCLSRKTPGSKCPAGFEDPVETPSSE